MGSPSDVGDGVDGVLSLLFVRVSFEALNPTPITRKQYPTLDENLLSPISTMGFLAEAREYDFDRLPEPSCRAPCDDFLIEDLKDVGSLADIEATMRV